MKKQYLVPEATKIEFNFEESVSASISHGPGGPKP